MLKNIILFFILITLSYSILVTFLPEDLDSDQGQWGANVVKGQTFIYETDTVKSVVLGTSLSNRLPIEKFDPKNKNLGLIGISIWDGYQLLKEAPIKPKKVFIETNFIFKGKSDLYDQSLYKNPWFTLRKYIPVLRDKYQPVGTLKGLLYRIIKGKEGNLDYSFKKEVTSPQLLSIQKEAFLKGPNSACFLETKAKLNAMIDDLKAKGVEVCFFEMPIHPELESLPLHQQQRILIQKIAKLKNVKILPPPDNHEYALFDGIHLNLFYAKQFYEKYLKNTIE